MHRSVVVADHHGSPFQHSSQFLEPGPSSQVPMDRPHRSGNLTHNSLVLVRAEKQSRGMCFLLDTVSQGGKPLRGPGLEPPPGPRMQTDERLMGVYPGFTDQLLGRHHRPFPDDERGRRKGAGKAQLVRHREVVGYRVHLESVGLDHISVQTTSPPGLTVVPDPDFRPCGPSQDGRTISIGQIDHRVEISPSQDPNQSQTVYEAPLVYQHFIHIRVPLQHFFRAPVYQHGEAGLGPSSPKSAQHRSG